MSWQNTIANRKYNVTFEQIGVYLDVIVGEPIGHTYVLAYKRGNVTTENL